MREGKRNAEQKLARILPEPMHRKQRQQFVSGGKGFQVVVEVVLQAGADQDGGAEGEKQQEQRQAIAKPGSVGSRESAGSILGQRVGDEFRHRERRSRTQAVPEQVPGTAD